MAAPATCVITFPPDGWTAGAAPDGTATLDVNCNTDPAVDVELFDGATSLDVGTSTAEGAYTFPAVVLDTGAHALKVVAGTDPDTTESAVSNVTVVDQLASIANPTDRTVQWYLNWLASSNVGAPALLSEREAACQWVGVSVLDYSLMGALNIKAGNPVGAWKKVKEVLNQIRLGVPGPNVPGPWLEPQACLYEICIAEAGA